MKVCYVSGLNKLDEKTRLTTGKHLPPQSQEGLREVEVDNTAVSAWDNTAVSAWVEALSPEEQQEIQIQGKIPWARAVRATPDKIAAFLLSREIGKTITNQQLKQGCETLVGIGVTVGLHTNDVCVLWSKLRPTDDDS